MDLQLPLENATIQRILPHRFPFLLVDRITELEEDTRIVGVKNISAGQYFLNRSAEDGPSLPLTVLTEAVGQVGAILILAKPENRDRLIYFMGIDRVRYKRPVRPGDVVEVEATVVRLRSKMGILRGIARVGGRVVLAGTMTFALSPPRSAAG